MFECFARPHVAPPLGDEAFLVCDDDAQKRGEYSLCEGASWEPGAGPAGIAALSLESGSLEFDALPVVGDAFCASVWLQLPLERSPEARPLLACGDGDLGAVGDALVAVDGDGELGVVASGAFHGCACFLDDVGAGWYLVTASSTLGHGTRFRVNGKHAGDARGRVAAGAPVRSLGCGARPWGSLVADARLFPRGLGDDEETQLLLGYAAAASAAPPLPPAKDRKLRAARARLGAAVGRVEAALRLLDAVDASVERDCGPLLAADDDESDATAAAALRDAARLASRALGAAALGASEAYDLDSRTRRAARRRAVDARRLLDAEALWRYASPRRAPELEPAAQLPATPAFGFLFAPRARSALAAAVAGAVAARADHVQVALVPHPDDADAAPLLPLACPPALAAKVRGALAPPEADVALFLFASKTGRLLSADGVDGVTTRGVAFLDDWAEKSHFMMVV